MAPTKAASVSKRDGSRVHWHVRWAATNHKAPLNRMLNGAKLRLYLQVPEVRPSDSTPNLKLTVTTILGVRRKRRCWTGEGELHNMRAFKLDGPSCSLVTGEVNLLYCHGGCRGVPGAYGNLSRGLPYFGAISGSFKRRRHEQWMAQERDLPIAAVT